MAPSGLVVQASVPPGLVPMARVTRVGGRGHRVADWSSTAHHRLGGPGRAVGPAAGLGGEGELGGRADGDGEGALVAPVSPVAWRSACSVPALPVILQPAKVAAPGWRRAGWWCRPACPAAGLVPMARVTGVGGRGHHVATGVLDGDRRLGGPAAPLAPPPGWVVKASLDGGTDGDGEGVAGGPVRPVAAGGQGVGAESAGDLAAGEGGHAGRGVRAGWWCRRACRRAGCRWRG